MRSHPHPFNIPFRIFCLTALLATIGVVMVYSSSANYAAAHNKKRIAKAAIEESEKASGKIQNSERSRLPPPSSAKVHIARNLQCRTRSAPSSSRGRGGRPRRVESPTIENHPLADGAT